MAIEISRTFNWDAGAVVSTVKDAVLGNTTVHTIYLTGAQGVADPEAAVAKILADVDAQAATLKERMIAAGWKANGN